MTTVLTRRPVQQLLDLESPHPVLDYHDRVGLLLVYPLPPATIFAQQATGADHRCVVGVTLVADAGGPIYMPRPYSTSHLRTFGLPSGAWQGSCTSILVGRGLSGCTICLLQIGFA